MKCRIKVGENYSDVIDFEQAANDVKHFVRVFGAKNVSIIFEQYHIVLTKNTIQSMTRVYPADKQGRCLCGFCPTICESNEADRIALDLAANMHKYGFKYDHIVVEDKP